MDENSKIALFKGKTIRRALDQGEWWFSVVDVVAALTDSANPRDYWFKMKIREKDEAEIELSTLCRQLKLESSDGKRYETDFELIFTMLGERATTEIHRTEDSEGMAKLGDDAHAGGSIAGNARKELEKRLKRPIVSKHNYLTEREAQKRLRERP